MPINRNNKDYIEGFNAERIRLAARDAARRALDANPSLPDIAREVAKHLSRDNARKTRILQRSPYVFAAMDAGELSQASSHELAARELKELGIEPGDNDPLAILDAHHAGRTYARDKISFAGIKGGAASAKGLLGGDGSAHDSADGSFVDRYLTE
jgi:hypothetical protein